MSEMKTPWQRVFARLGMSQKELAAEMDRHRSKICVALRDEKGLINGRDQAELVRIGRARGIELTIEDFTG